MFLQISSTRNPAHGSRCVAPQVWDRATTVAGAEAAAAAAKAHFNSAVRKSDRQAPLTLSGFLAGSDLEPQKQKGATASHLILHQPPSHLRSARPRPTSIHVPAAPTAATSCIPTEPPFALPVALSRACIFLSDARTIRPPADVTLPPPVSRTSSSSLAGTIDAVPCAAAAAAWLPGLSTDGDCNPGQPEPPLSPMITADHIFFSPSSCSTPLVLAALIVQHRHLLRAPRHGPQLDLHDSYTGR